MAPERAMRNWRIASTGPVPDFGCDRGLAIEHRPSGRFGVNGIGLAAQPAVLTIGAVHLHDNH
ncbi:MAG: hypothetical protein ACRDOX_14350, partial [Nocardioides sp.]